MTLQFCYASLDMCLGNVPKCIQGHTDTPNRRAHPLSSTEVWALRIMLVAVAGLLGWTAAQSLHDGLQTQGLSVLGVLRCHKTNLDYFLPASSRYTTNKMRDKHPDEFCQPRACPTMHSLHSGPSRDHLVQHSSCMAASSIAQDQP